MEPSNDNHKSICLPMASEAEYRKMVDDTERFRHFIERSLGQYPELFPAEMVSGFTLHDCYYSSKQAILLRRIKIKASGDVFQIRPSFLMPYMSAKTDDIEKALYLRQWGVPFEALAYVFGRDAMFYYRAWLTLGRSSIVGTTVKDRERLPDHLVADEKHTWWQGQKVYIPTTVGSGCFLGATVVADASGEALEAGYGEFAREARHVDPTYHPQTVCTDGWTATREAWSQLFPQITLILCFLHSVLKILDRCRGQIRQQIKEKAWHVYQAETKRAFAQRLRRFVQWANDSVGEGAVLLAIVKMWQHRPDFLKAYDFPHAHRTSNGVDRLMDYQDRMLYQMRYFHGTKASACLAVKAMALQWNFHPYGARIQSGHMNRASPFDDLNGFQYHTNWLHNLLIASSRGGRYL